MPDPQFKPGDVVVLAEEAKSTSWYGRFIEKNGHGPFVVLRVVGPLQDGLHLAHMNGEEILRASSGRLYTADVGLAGHWMVLHPFLTEAYAAIKGETNV